MSNNNQQGKRPDPLEREVISGEAAQKPEDAVAAAAALVKQQEQELNAAMQAKNYSAAPNTGRYGTDDFLAPAESAIAMEDIRSKAHAALDAEQMLHDAAMSKEDYEYAMFMEEKVLIVVHESPNEEELQVVCPMVNGMSQPIVRGHPTIVKRKYVEVLARAKESKYKQVQVDSNQPDSLQLIPRTVVAWPFSVERDDNPRGRAWLREILQQSA